MLIHPLTLLRIGFLPLPLFDDTDSFRLHLLQVFLCRRLVLTRIVHRLLWGLHLLHLQNLLLQDQILLLLKLCVSLRFLPLLTLFYMRIQGYSFSGFLLLWLLCNILLHLSHNRITTHFFLMLYDFIIWHSMFLTWDNVPRTYTSDMCLTALAWLPLPVNRQRPSC